MGLKLKVLSSLCVLLVLQFSYQNQAKAEWNPTFGPEFNFTNDQLILNSDPDQIQTVHNIRAQKKIFRIAKKKCPECQIEIGKSMYGIRTYRLHLPEGWWIEFDLDPAVVEVKMSPLSLDQIERYESTIQRLVFDSAKEAGLLSLAHGGHLHLGLRSSFGDDFLLFRNFIVDTAIYSKATYKLFESNARNSPTLDLLGRAAISNFKEILRQFDDHFFPASIRPRAPLIPIGLDRALGFPFEDQFLPPVPEGLFKDSNAETAIEDLKHAVLKHVHSISPKHGADERPHKYQHLSLFHHETVELRSMPEARSANHYTRIAKLMYSRLNYLRGIHAPLRFKEVRKVQINQDAVDLYFKYVEQSGMPWKEVVDLLPYRKQYLQPFWDEWKSCRRLLSR